MSIVRDVMRAVHGSSLPAPGRHLVLTLCSLADEETGIVPEADSPSMSDLAEMTGLGRSTVARMLNLVEECKWIERLAPSAAEAWAQKVSNRYTVAVGTSPAVGLVQVGHETETTSTRAGLVPERDQSETDNVGLETVSTSPAAGHASIRTKDSLSKTSSTSPKKSGRPRVDNDRPDVVEICTHLADSVESLGFKRPLITKEWRVQARLLLDEKRPRWQPTVQSVKDCVDWTHDHKFWWKNVQSMPTLREQWDRLCADKLDEKRAAEGREQPRANSRAPTPPAAPAAVPRAEQCPKHLGQRAATCGRCRSERLASQPQLDLDDNGRPE